MTVDNFKDVGDFHEKFGLYRVGTWAEGAGPTEVNDDLLNFRIKFLFEELQEFLEGVGYVFEGTTLWDEAMGRAHKVEDVPDHAQMADALIDLVYVAMGTAHVLGYPWHMLWNDVQRANMEKERAAADGSNSLRKSSFDVVKPPGWKPPLTKRILQYCGFKQYDND